MTIHVLFNNRMGMTVHVDSQTYLYIVIYLLHSENINGRHKNG